MPISNELMLTDGMTPVLRSIKMSVSMVSASFASIQSAAGSAMDMASFRAAKIEISGMSAALNEYQENLKNTPPAAAAPMPEWNGKAGNVMFMNSGAERFTSEINAAKEAAEQLYRTQQEITGKAIGMDSLPSGMMNDMAAMQNRIETFSNRVKELSTIPVALRTDKTNNELEALRGKMEQIGSVQQEMNTAMSELDVGAANTAYNQLVGLVDTTEKDIRNNLAGQVQFNQAVQAGKTAAANLGKSIRDYASKLVSISNMKKVLSLADDFTQTTMRLELLNDGLQSTDQLNQKIFASAQSSRVPYMAMADAVTKMGTNAGGAFQSNDEMLAFTEQAGKQFALGGASAQEQANAVTQLSQAMADGKISSEELNSILQAGPGIGRAIEQSMGWAEGSVRQYAEQGAVSAQIVKDSLLNMSGETNEKFNAIPATFGQVMTTVQNSLLESFQPILQGLANGASFIVENWPAIEPIFYGVAAGAVALAIGLGIQALASKLSVTSMKEFFSVLMTNPLTWIVLVIGILVAMIYKWVQSVGGLKIAWLICVNAVMTLIENLLYAFSGAWMNLKIGLAEMEYGFSAFGVAVQNAVGNMKVNVLLILQGLVNGAIGLVNDMITTINKAFGTSIPTITWVAEFGTNAAIEEAEKQAQRNAELADKWSQKEADRLALIKDHVQQGINNQAARAERDAEIAAGQNDQARTNAEESNQNPAVQNPGIYNPAVQDQEEMAASMSNTAGNTARMADSMESSDEDLGYLREIAERESINRYTTAQIKVDQTNNNSISSNLDFDGMMHGLTGLINDAIDYTVEGVHG